jgi:uncharacterized protein (DUF1778 family)
MIDTGTQIRIIHLKVPDDVWSLIDGAAKVQGKTRSDFMIDAARRAAEDALPDQALVSVEAESCNCLTDILDNSLGNEGFQRLMNVTKPWQA